MGAPRPGGRVTPRLAGVRRTARDRAKRDPVLPARRVCRYSAKSSW
jgi:hypothetical protein